METLQKLNDSVNGQCSVALKYIKGENGGNHIAIVSFDKTYKNKRGLARNFVEEMKNIGVVAVEK